MISLSWYEPGFLVLPHLFWGILFMEEAVTGHGEFVFYPLRLYHSLSDITVMIMCHQASIGS